MHLFCVLMLEVLSPSCLLRLTFLVPINCGMPMSPGALAVIVFLSTYPPTEAGFKEKQNQKWLPSVPFQLNSTSQWLGNQKQLVSSTKQLVKSSGSAVPCSYSPGLNNGKENWTLSFRILLISSTCPSRQGGDRLQLVCSAEILLCH